MSMSAFRALRDAARRFGRKALPAVVAMIALFSALGAAQPARAADEIPGWFTQSAAYDCRTNTVVYDIELTIPPDTQAAVQAAEGGSLRVEIISDLPAGLKWISATAGGDSFGITAEIQNRLRDSDRLVAGIATILPWDSDGDGKTGTIKVRAVAEVAPGMPVPHTFAHTARLNVLVASGGGVLLYAEGLESTPPGVGLGTITRTGVPTEVTVDPAACGPDPADPGRPGRGEACLSAEAAVYCGDNPGEYTVILTGETDSPDYVIIEVLTPGVFIDVMGSLERVVAAPAVAGTYYIPLAIVGATPGSAITFSIASTTGDVGVVQDLPNGFALCCSTELVVVIPPECERLPVADPIFDLKIEKEFEDESCEVGERCMAKITVTNESDVPHVGDVEFRDSADGKPYRFGAIMAAHPVSCTTSPTEVSCTLRDANLPPRAVSAWEFYVPIIPEPAAADTVIENCADIVQQPGSTDTNATNDRGCDTIAVPAPETTPWDLKIIKEFTSETCSVGEPCGVRVTISNESDVPHSGHVSFVDDVSGRNFTLHEAPGAPWVCSIDNCTYPNANLAAHGSIHVEFAVMPTEAAAGTMIENCVDIVQQPDSLDTNDRNDRGCDTVPVSQPTQPAGRWNLKIEKNLGGGSDGICEVGERCHVYVRVTNTTDFPHAGDIVVTDDFADKPFTIPSAGGTTQGWEIEIAGTRLTARLPNANLAPHDSKYFNLHMVPTEAAAGTTIENCAEIQQPPGSADAVGTDDRNCVTMQVPAPAQQPEPMPEPVVKNDLSITKTSPSSCQATASCTYNITVANQAQGIFEGDLVISDVPGDPGAVFQGHSPASWSCSRAANGVLCSQSGVRLAQGKPASLSLTFQVPDSPALRRAGLENCAYLGGEAAGPVSKGTDVRSVQQALSGFGFDPGPIDGAFGRRTASALRSFQTSNALAVTGTITPETLERLGLTGGGASSEPFVDDFADDNAYCVTTPITAPPAPVCAAGQTLKDGKCQSICPSGTEWRNGACRTIVIQCPAGQEFRNGRCRNIIVECPAGTEFRNGRCRSICPGDQQWINGKCQCPAGTTWKDGKCQSIQVQCPTGQRLVNGRCVPILIFCPPGEVLVNGKCIRLQIQCPAGQEFRNGRCRSICQGGQEWINGKCQCPPGTSLKRGKCQPNQTEIPGTTTPGTVTPGPSEINPQSGPTSCGSGEVMVNGRCVKLQLKIPNLGTIRIQ
ncbi:MAG: peptidoglycan-binding protein [Rhodobiaceae bacterium]|nr:peptidoglycan-binding protein [Rhodobiaceae bacterium]MCC0042211.1 peptidoglycan-binding protein [Rhodobiaceae bacterium]